MRVGWDSLQKRSRNSHESKEQLAQKPAVNTTSQLPELLHRHTPEPTTDERERTTWSWSGGSASFLWVHDYLKTIWTLVESEVVFGKKGGFDSQ